MADYSLYNLSYKRSVSTNDKADIIAARLHELKIAITIMQRHPNVLNEFVCAVKGGANLPAVTFENQIDRQRAGIKRFK